MQLSSNCAEARAIKTYSIHADADETHLGLRAALCRPNSDQTIILMDFVATGAAQRHHAALYKMEVGPSGSSTMPLCKPAACLGAY